MAAGLGLPHSLPSRYPSPGGIPGFLNMTLSTPDGRRQLGLMINVGDRAPSPVIDAFIEVFRGPATRLAA